MPNAETAAAGFRSRHGLGGAPIRDIVQVVESYFGVGVASFEFPSGCDALTMRDAQSGVTLIAVAVTANYERQRFSIAHELGHLVSEKLSTDIHALPEYQRNPDEIWADDFARHFLLPKSSVSRYLTDQERTKGKLGVESVSNVVRTYGVSPSVAMIQLRDTQWISQRQSTEWTKAIPAWSSRRLSMHFGWSAERDTLVKSSLSPRRPTWIVSAATAAYVDRKTSLEALAHAAGQRDLNAFRRSLEDADVVPASDADEDGELREPEDLTDLYRDVE